VKKFVLATFASGLWIGVSEFLRNEILFNRYWVEKYADIGQTFPSAPINGALWAVWSFFLAGCIVFLSRMLTMAQTITIAWIFAFVMMWIVLWNLNVLPVGLLPIAVPWSVGEVAVAALIAGRILGPTEAEPTR